MAEAGAAPGQVTPGLLDEAGTICMDRPCRRCGYNLRGLNHAWRCPECGTPVGLSCHGDLLRFADPNWVETLGRGARYILWGVLVAIVVAVAGVGLAATFGGRGAIPTLLSILGGLVGLYGAWLITTRDPSGIGEDKYVTDRKIVRIALIAGLAGNFFDLVTESIPLAKAVLFTLFALQLLAGLAYVVGEFAKLTYFQKLASRIPDEGLANRARSLRWALAFSLGVGLPSGILTAICMALSSGGPAATGGTPGATGALAGGAIAFGCIAFVAGIVYAIVAILILVLVYRLGKAFREQAQVARQTWAAAQPGSPPAAPGATVL